MSERGDQTIQCVQRARPYVDRIVIVHEGVLSQEVMDKLSKEYGCELYYRHWDDNFPAQRNEYLKRVTEGWVLVTDSDELPGEELLKNLKNVVKMSVNGGRFNACKIAAHDITANDDGTQQPVTVSGFKKLLFFKWYPGIHYEGIGVSKTVHEELVGANWNIATLPDDYYYEHYKKSSEVWNRAFRNFHCGGGGNNLGKTNPVWNEYRGLLAQVNPKLLEWAVMEEYIKKGSIDQRIKDFLIKHKNRNVIPDADCEVQESFKYYFDVLHPEENTGKWVSIPDPTAPEGNAEIRNYVEQCYLTVLQRHADEPGKVAYTEHILSGRLRKADLPFVLMKSDEYKMKQESTALLNSLITGKGTKV